MPAVRTYYVICEDNCRFEGMTKEEIFDAIADATGNTPTPVDEAFITKIKEQNANHSIKIWKGTQAQYNALSETDSDTIYFIGTNAVKSVDGIEDDITAIESDIETIEGKIPSFEADARYDKYYHILILLGNTGTYTKAHGLPLGVNDTIGIDYEVVHACALKNSNPEEMYYPIPYVYGTSAIKFLNYTIDQTNITLTCNSDWTGYVAHLIIGHRNNKRDTQL